MISVENFYWILHANLLQPLEMGTRYYYPWGTKNFLSLSEFESPPYGNRHLNHVLFHFDQEPLWSDDLGKIYDSLEASWIINKYAKLLANSEWSDTKKQICKNRNMLDWYFFYHGFAAIDWYRDSVHIRDSIPPTKIFCSLNHNIRHQRSYRLSLTARLIAAGLWKHGDISLRATRQDIEHEIEDPNTFLNVHDLQLIKIYLLNRVPLIVDQCDVDSKFSAHFGFHELKFWQRSFWHVVNETVFYPNKLHLTEKTFKPIVAMRPFLLVAAPGNLKYLQNYGFRTFDTWIDESYDQIYDPTLRLEKITQEITKLCNMTRSQLMEIYQDMLPTLKYNKEHLFGEFRKIITNELVDNFDQCIRIWNNGRVDARKIALHSNLDQIKKTLLM